MPEAAGHDFDAEAVTYEDTLNRGLAVSGEKASFFAEARMVFLAKRLRQLGFAPRTAIDYGCGTGGSTVLLLRVLSAESILGLDPSGASLEIARQRAAGQSATYALLRDHRPNEDRDLVFCNGVFHHISPSERLQTLRYMAACLRPGGVLALWENNPWNPGTRYIMRRIPFDRDAIPVRSTEARALVRAAKLNVLRTDYCFIFPGVLRVLRPLERGFTRLPIGAQYLVLSRKPVKPGA